MQTGGNSDIPDPSGQSDAEESAAWDGRDRRLGDRRDAPTRPWTSLFTPKRRATGRRRDEDRSSYVDRYSRRDVALLISIFLLNVGDAFFTMRWLDRGGLEANPVMDFFLDIGPGAFLAQKCLVVGFWLLLLLVHKNFRFARVGLYASLAAYAVLMAVHFAIIALGIEPPKQVHVPAAEPEHIIQTADRPRAE